MARKIQQWVNGQTIDLLNRLADTGTNAEAYRRVMYEIGVVLGNKLLEDLDGVTNVNLASTVEDADFLGKGIIDTLEQAKKNVLLTVYWNKNFKPNNDNNISIAPIIKEFHETSTVINPDVLIIIKSIISSSCVIRTNLTRFIEDSSPSTIFVVAPVLLSGSIASLELEFPLEISSRFRYMYLAEDTERSNQGIVLPGIGGDVYQRLGFGGQEQKNRFTPNIVRERRIRQNAM
jgi:hypothetical protein